ncbi:hypothetical protein AB0X79_07940 [Pediococcus pentosaceus]|uniref:hypothetical protein n=1 Tax=Pediococcus pentosaceus TaxID=1255 RepID=UPI003F1F2C84
MYMFGRKEIKKEYYLKVGTMFVSSDPWMLNLMIKRQDSPKMDSIAFSDDESEAWTSSYSEIKELQDMLGGEIYRITTEAERVL